MAAISVRELRKSFGDVQAVKGITFDVPEGSFFAFLGPNGAGKSTTISIICSLLARDSGDVTVFGKDTSDPSMRNSIGVVFQDSMMDQRLTVRENIRIRGAMYGLEDLDTAVDTAISEADATEFADRPYGKLSGGQRRRADIARALVHRPRLLILDEPTAGLDPQTRKNIWETITDLNRGSGLTVFLTTHYMEEAAGADDIVVINNGEIVAHGTPATLRESFCSDSMLVQPKDMDSVKKVLDGSGIRYNVENDTIVIPLASTLDSVPIIASLDGMMLSLEVRTGTLDDAFINITGEAIE
ncbi:MAG: ABC transporter ATP-binding protein [Candidatus Methanomethylophilaceae archaeon]|nr:ABC transporter ATP-binding protein [Candidatus Methanomethylophilaceae archaeon]